MDVLPDTSTPQKNPDEASNGRLEMELRRPVMDGSNPISLYLLAKGNREEGGWLSCCVRQNGQSTQVEGIQKEVHKLDILGQFGSSPKA